MHFILTPLYFLFHVWAANAGEVDPLFTVIPVLVLLGVSIFLRLVAGLFLDKYAANVLITSFWWLFGTYGSLYSGIKDAIFWFYPKLEFQGEVAFDLPVVLLFLELGIFCMLFRLLRTKVKAEGNGHKTIVRVNSFLNGMTSFLVVIVLSSIISQILNSSRSTEVGLPGTNGNGSVSVSTSVLPNIYHIIVDGYGREDVLFRYFGFDNSSFIRHLESNGFAVVRESWANYSITQASLTSTLNLDYFENIINQFGNSGVDGLSVTRGFATNAIRNNRLVREMKAIGYHYLHIGSIWEATIRNPNADLEYGCSRFNLHNEFTRALIARSWLAPFEHLGGASIARCHQRMFSNLEEISRSHHHQPYYVFAHVVLPHYPYVFNSDCSIKAQVEMSNAFSLRKELWNDSASYLAQLRCVNSMLTEAVNIIVRHDPDSWIVIHSDHGPDIPKLAEMTRISARLANFLAIRAPDGSQLNPDFHSPLGAWRKIVGLLTNASMDGVERFFYIPDDESGSLKSWKEYTIEELERGIKAK